LAIGGIIAIALGALTLIDVAQAPDLFVAYSAIAPALLVLVGIVLTIGWKIAATRRQRPSVGFGALTGLSAEVVEARGLGCRVRVRGEVWLASASEGEEFRVGDRVVVASHEGNVLIVKKGG
jgi:membrane-bound ClpP family serine protease